MSRRRLHRAARPQRRRQDARCSRSSLGSTRPRRLDQRVRLSTSGASRRGARAGSASCFRAARSISISPSMQNLLYHAALHGIGRRARRAPRAAALARVGLADGPRRGATLSGGQMRRVEIARALLHRPASAAARRADGRPRRQGAPSILSLMSAGCCRQERSRRAVGDPSDRRGRSRRRVSSCCIGAACWPQGGSPRHCGRSARQPESATPSTGSSARQRGRADTS